MNPMEIAIHEYNRLLYGTDMYDVYGAYNWDLADERKKQLVAQYGQELLDAVAAKRAVKQKDYPEEYRLLQAAREVLRPYWKIEDDVWAMYPPSVKQKHDEYLIAQNRSELEARNIARANPNIIWAELTIARMKEVYLQRNPTAKYARDMFYIQR